MKPPPPRPRIDVDEALRLRNEERLSAVEIARRLGFTAQAVRRAIRRHGGSLLPDRSHRTVPHGRRLYSLWLSLRARCSSPSHPLFPRFGGRGIRVGAAWRTFWPFYDWALARKLLDWKEIVRLYREEDLTVQEIARRFDASDHGVRKGLKARGVWNPKPVIESGTLRKTFEQMHSRCADERHVSYAYYGARGARVCAEWSSFEAFREWAQGSGYRRGLCITRRPGTRVYSPANCRWSTRAEANDAARRGPPPRRPRWTVEAFGETKGPTAWSRDPRCCLSPTGLIHRLRGGWHPEAAITTPPQTPGRVNGPEVLITAFHRTRSLTDWGRDRRCKVSVTTIADRIRRGIAPEAAITTPAFQLPARRAAEAERPRLQGKAISRGRSMRR